MNKRKLVLMYDVLPKSISVHTDANAISMKVTVIRIP